VVFSGHILFSVLKLNNDKSPRFYHWDFARKSISIVHCLDILGYQTNFDLKALRSYENTNYFYLYSYWITIRSFFIKRLTKIC